MNKKTLIKWGLAVFIVFTAVFVYFRVQKGEFTSFSGKRNYILVTVDTLRADRIGCYGFPGVDTPVMDMFAARGVKFEHCIAQTPLTLPSHTSLMTGTFPAFHGVRDNGGFLVPQELTTLAELFKKEGYSTSAFVAAYVLDSKWGLDQGFDLYFDDFDLSKYKTISLGKVQRRGDEVINQVLPWIDEHKQEPFFAWIHLYDPHTPYEPPPPFDTNYAGRPYAGEVAYTDTQLGRLWQHLEENGLTENTVLVFASDHGESLGEHEESSHGFFVYQEGIHVPLIFVTPFERFHGLSRSSVVSLVDIMPTILDMAGIEPPDVMQGQSLLPLFRKEKEGPGRFAYAETFYPRLHYGWSELTTIQEERYKLIVAPRLELYDLQNDPEEMVNLIDSLPREARRLMSRIELFTEETSQNAFEVDYSALDEETRQKLTALGYIGTFTDIQEEGRRLGDPKDKIVVFNRLSQGRELGMQGEYEEAVRIIQEILKDDPDVIDAYFALGNVYHKWGRFQDALDSFSRAFEKRPNDPFTVINMANAHLMMKEFDEAEQLILSMLPVLPPDSQLNFILGNIYAYKKDYVSAEKIYRETLRLNPSSASAYNALGKINLLQEKLDEAEEFFKKAMEFSPMLTDLHYNLAQLHEARGDLEKAAEEYLIELENVPENFGASFNLSRIYRLGGQVEKEEEFLEMTIENNPYFPMSYFFLARIYLNRGEKYEEAVELVKTGIENRPEEKDLPLGYFLLADLYNRLGDRPKSQEYARKGQSLVQDSRDGN